MAATKADRQAAQDDGPLNHKPPTIQDHVSHSVQADRTRPIHRIKIMTSFRSLLVLGTALVTSLSGVMAAPAPVSPQASAIFAAQPATDSTAPARIILIDSDEDEGEDDDDEGEGDDDDDCDDDDGGWFGGNACDTSAQTAPTGQPMTPPANGLFQNGTAPKAQIN